MSRDQAKPTPKHAKAAAAPDPKLDALAAGKLAGKVKFDDRGNAIWEWAQNTEAFTSEGPAQPMKRLDNPALAIADDVVVPGGRRPNPLGTLKGYDPYESGELAKPTAKPAKKRDLRKLGEWLKSQKLADKGKPDAK